MIFFIFSIFLTCLPVPKNNKKILIDASFKINICLENCKHTQMSEKGYGCEQYSVLLNFIEFPSSLRMLLLPRKYRLGACHLIKIFLNIKKILDTVVLFL